MATTLEGNPDLPKKALLCITLGALVGRHFLMTGWAATHSGSKQLSRHCWSGSAPSCPLTPRRAAVLGLWGPAWEEQRPLASSSLSLKRSCLGLLNSGGKTQTCHARVTWADICPSGGRIHLLPHSLSHSFIHMPFPEKCVPGTGLDTGHYNADSWGIFCRGHTHKQHSTHAGHPAQLPTGDGV